MQNISKLALFGLLAILYLIPATTATQVGFCFNNRKCQSEGTPVSYDPSSNKQGNLPGGCAGFKNTYSRAFQISEDSCAMTGSQTQAPSGICKQANNVWTLICPS